jgi:hypothetical protein
MDAAKGGHHECLSILLAHGAEMNRVDNVSLVGVTRIGLQCMILLGFGWSK